LSAQILAAISIKNISTGTIDDNDIKNWIYQLIERHFVNNNEGISGFFMEKDQADGYRSIAFSTFPAMAVLKAFTYFKTGEMPSKLAKAVTSYIRDYLLVDTKSNPYGIVPYGVFFNPEYINHQFFRKYGSKLMVRTFIPVFSKQEIIHGTSSVITAHAGFLSEAARIFNNPEWQQLAEKQVQWALGHNTHGLSLSGGIGYRHTVAYNTIHSQIPEAAVAGFIGRPDDSPYIETTNWLEWSTQEIWDVPYYGMLQFVLNGQ
jgi:hypothetical protein